MKTHFYTLLADGLERLGIEIEGDAYDRLFLYFSELKKWNKKVNLVAKRTSDDDLVENHFLDSLALLPIFAKSGIHLMDIGSGAGFPGLVCKAALPKMTVTLVEPRLKRVSFLKHIIRVLGLKNVQVLECRIEDESALDSNLELSHITCRAVAELRDFLAMVERFSPSKAQVVCMKGPRWKKEIAEVEMSGLPFMLGKVEEYTLPFSGGQRSLLFFDYNNSKEGI